MRKLLAFLTILFLLACSSGLSGTTTTTCTNAPRVFVENDTVVIIEGYDEEIRLWTRRITLTREQFIQHMSDDDDITDEEIVEMFDFLNSLKAEGFELVLVSLTDEEVIMEYIYDYSIISDEDLNEIWDVDDFEREVTLSAAIRGLEEQEAICETE